MFRFVLHEAGKIKAWGRRENAAIDKALGSALKREGWMLMNEMRGAIRTGRPGGQSYNPLSIIAGYRYTGGYSKRKPYTGIGGRRGLNTGLRGNMIPIRYHYKKLSSRGGQSVTVGVVGGKKQKISASWQRIFRRQQEGFRAPVDMDLRQELAWRAYSRNSKVKAAHRDFFLLKPQTTHFVTPARPVVDPFWDKEQGKSLARFEKTFAKKLRALAGEGNYYQGRAR